MVYVIHNMFIGQGHRKRSGLKLRLESKQQSIIIIIMAINLDNTVIPINPNQPLTGFQFPKRSATNASSERSFSAQDK